MPSPELPQAPGTPRLPALVAIVGGGSIGGAFAIVWAIAGVPVRLFDPDAERRQALPGELASQLGALAAHGLAGKDAAAVTAGRIAIFHRLDATVAGAELVLESAPERLALKQLLFADIERVAPPDAVLASTSSMLPISDIAGALASRVRCLIIHPGNPPTLIKVAEIVPAPFTAVETTTRAMDFLAAAGMAPLLVRKEVEGFVFNRLQGAVLREAYCLVRDGVADVETIDRLVRDGLGLRWSVVGPFETVDLNTRGGIVAHAERMGPAYRRMGNERGQDDPWTPDLVEKVAAQRRALLPLKDWGARVAWRDRRLMALVAARARSA